MPRVSSFWLDCLWYLLVKAILLLHRSDFEFVNGSDHTTLYTSRQYHALAAPPLTAGYCWSKSSQNPHALRSCPHLNLFSSVCVCLHISCNIRNFRYLSSRKRDKQDQHHIPYNIVVDAHRTPLKALYAYLCILWREMEYFCAQKP